MSILLNATHILLADDDKDDDILFRDVLEELTISTRLSTVHNGEHLILLLKDEKAALPDVLFLDLNMPRKSGFECLAEIKSTERLKQLPVIIFTTSSEPGVINLLYKKGAQFYIRKPNDFESLKKVVHLALTLIAQKSISQPSREKFVLS